MKCAHVKAIPGHLYVHTVRPCYLFFIGYLREPSRLSLLFVFSGMDAWRNRFSDPRKVESCQPILGRVIALRSFPFPRLCSPSPEDLPPYSEGLPPRSEGRPPRS